MLKQLLRADPSIAKFCVWLLLLVSLCNTASLLIQTIARFLKYKRVVWNAITDEYYSDSKYPIVAVSVSFLGTILNVLVQGWNSIAAWSRLLEAMVRVQLGVRSVK